MTRVLANSRKPSGYHSFVFLPTTYIYSVRVNIFELWSNSSFCVMQSRVHESWARFLGSTHEDRLMYALSDCFGTFPFPQEFESLSSLELVGREYYDLRGGLMIRADEGLTKTYNRFHDPNEESPEIRRLRELHDAMDRAVLDAYGWHDIKPVSEFFPEFDNESEDPTARPKRMKYLYRGPEKIHDEVLARLL